MQKVKLSIDCSGQDASFILTDQNNKPVSDLLYDSSDRLLFKSLPSVLKENNIAIENIDLIAWGQGPGSFTGIRICATWLQSLAYTHQIKVVPVCSLRARAQQYIEKNCITNGTFSAHLSANRAYDYFGQWTITDGLVVPMKPVSVINKDELNTSDIDLGPYEATALNIHKISQSLEGNSINYVTAFEIRPNYLFDHFS